jgi:hypothetical protein
MAIIYLDRPLPAGSPEIRDATYPLDEHLRCSYPGRISSMLGLAGGGVCPADAVTCIAVRSCRTISPLPVPTEGSSAVYFLWHFPAGRPGWSLATTVALPCSDFPPCAAFATQSDHPTHSEAYYTKKRVFIEMN